METTHFSPQSDDTVTTIDSSGTDRSSDNDVDVMMVLSSVIASVGVVSNLIVAAVFLNDKKLRRKIPNIFIINQVSYFLT